MFKKIISGAMIVFALFGIASPAAATTGPTYYSSTNNFYFKDFTADYFLMREEDGTSRMVVIEELTAVFPSSNQNHGITRVIPFTNNDGKNLTIDTGDTIYMDVERNGKEEPVSKVEIGDGYYYVYIGDPDSYVHGEQTYTLTYEFNNVVLDFEDGFKKWQELYWDANGNDWQQRFDNVTARVHMGEDIAEKFTGETSCYVGGYGESGQDRCTTKEYNEEIEVSDDFTVVRSVEFSAKRLMRGETLTFVMEFDDDTFAPAPQHFDYTIVVSMAGIILLGGGMIALIIVRLKATSEKRKYYAGLFVKPEYTPAKDLTVAEMAENHIGRGTNGDARVATLLELAVSHKIEMVKTEKDGAFGKKKTQWMIRIKTDTLNKQQATILKILAGSDTPLHKGQEIYVKSHTATSELAELSTRFGTSIKASLEKKGLLEKKEKGFHAHSILPYATAFWFFAWMFIIIIILNNMDEKPYMTLVGGLPALIVLISIWLVILIASLIVAVKTHQFLTHTKKGLEYSRYLDGLKMYMQMAEADRIKMLQSVKGADTTHQGVVKIYEKLLPYAAIFRMEKSWLEELSHYYEFADVTAPVWYMGIGAFSAREFSSAMMAANSSLSSTITHSTISNSSSGFSGGGGGGFAGGGGGGGGGGGW